MSLWRLHIVAVAALAVCLAAPSRAAAAAQYIVYPQYGDFFLDYIDMPVTSGGLEMKVERIYNSVTSVSGIFGYGWGCWFEEHLEVRDDGAIVVHEWGSGAANVFTPTGPASTRSRDAIVAEVMAAAEQSGEFGSDAERSAYRAWLADHADAEWTRFRDLGLVKPPEIPVGATFASSRFGTQLITRVPEGYQRETIGGTTYRTGATFEAFDLSGRLQRLWDLDHNYIALRYDARGRLAEMDDNGRNLYTFELSPYGLVQRITDSQGRTSFYEYSGTELVRSVDSSGAVREYEYNDPTNENLTAIRFADSTSTEITYGLLNNFIYVEKIKDRDKSVTTYTYVFKKAAAGCTEGVDVVVRDAAGAQKSQSHEDHAVNLDQCG